jgi:bacterioferritin
MAKIARDQNRKKVVETLNKARSMELHAIYEYMNQHYNLTDMDYGELAAKVKLIAIDEMRHAEMLAERIEELGGQPTTDLAQKVVKGQPVDVIFSFDADIENETIEVYNGFREICRESGDSTSMKLFETIIDEEQIHFNYFDNIGSHIKKLGQAFLARIAGTPADAGLPARGFVAAQGGAA